MAPSRLKTFVSNRVGRVGEICRKVPANQWRYVATEYNPADYASRGLSPHDLLQMEMWWDGPPWLILSPDAWPRRPDIESCPTSRPRSYCYMPKTHPCGRSTPLTTDYSEPSPGAIVSSGTARAGRRNSALYSLQMNWSRLVSSY